MDTDPEKSGIPAQNSTIVLVGLMGAGKTSVGRKLARLLDIPFVDADHEIEAAAGCSIEGFFELYGEAEFRKGEEKVIQRLLETSPQVLATGGGAFINPSIRAIIASKGISVWLRAALDILHKRTARRGGRPLLNGDCPEQVLKKLIHERYPVYAGADIIVDTNEENIDLTVENIVDALRDFTKE